MARSLLTACGKPQICIWNSPAPEQWRIVRMSDLFSRITRKISSEDLPILSISAKIGFLTQEERYSRFMAGESLKRYTELHRGEFAYNKGNSQTYPHGCIYPLKDYQKAAVPHVYYCFKNRIEIDPEFFAQYFAAGGLNAQLARINNAGVRGNGLLNIGADEFFDLEVPLPPLSEQRKIAAILRSVHGAIQTTQAVIDQTRTVKQGLLQELLNRGIGHTRFKQTEIGEIPEGWVATKLGDIAEFVNGRGFKPHEWGTTGYPIIRIQNLNGSTNFNFYSGSFDPKILVRVGTLLFAWSGSRGTSFGPHVWNGPDGVLNYHTWKVIPTTDVDQAFLLFSLRQLTRHVEQDAHGASALVHMQKRHIVDYTIPLPSLDEQREIASILRAVDEAESLEARKLEQLESLKRGLLQDLLTGRVRVPTAV